LAEPIRVLVAEDSPTVRRRIVSVLSSEPGFTVVGEAADGKRAIELCQSLKPDVITMDMMMPVMTGLAATEYIMAFCPTPIVVVSGSTNRGEMFRTYEALSAGALEIVEKPRADEALETWERSLIDTVRIASRVRVITHPRARLRASMPPVTSDPLPLRGRVATARIVAIGASTGGPKAIVDVLQMLPADFRIPIAVVTHISEAFSAGLAEWLGANVPMPVRIARHGDPVLPGVSVAPADTHMIVSGDRIELTRSAPRHSCRPSVDMLFESAARDYGSEVAGVLLTGMGRDGADGLLAIRRAGGLTIAQDEASCTIFGMPAEAINLGAAEHVLPPAAIGELLRGLTPSGIAVPRS
jgi:two-component system chemotaxis response regulator CheB